MHHHGPHRYAARQLAAGSSTFWYSRRDHCRPHRRDVKVGYCTDDGGHQTAAEATQCFRRFLAVELAESFQCDLIQCDLCRPSPVDLFLWLLALLFPDWWDSRHHWTRQGYAVGRVKIVHLCRRHDRLEWLCELIGDPARLMEGY